MTRRLLGYRAVDLLFEPRDLWVGVYWARQWVSNLDGQSWQFLSVYGCLLPMLPIRITYRWKATPTGDEGESDAR